LATLFVDSAFYVAVLDNNDQLHDSAIALQRDLASRSQVNFVTTDSVLVEVLTYVSRFGPRARERAAELVVRLMESRGVTVLPQSRPLFLRALDLYRARLDKHYSMTDCMSFVVCRDRNIAEVLTADRDFEREGFRILLQP
jgi:predicted nucleic acid-binding protein